MSLVKTIREHFQSDLADMVAGMEFDVWSTKQEISDQIMDVAQSNHCAYSVDYGHEQYEAINDSDLCKIAYEMGMEELDFSHCCNAWEAIEHEARAIVASASYYIMAEVVGELAETIYDFLDTCQDNGLDGEIKLYKGNRYGTLVHDYESSTGICCYSDIEGEDEFCAAELCIIKGLYTSIAWHGREMEVN